MREPRPSVASRLGPKIGGQGHQKGSGASESGPVPRVRSTNDSGEVKGTKRSRITFDSDRNVSEVSSAKKRSVNMQMNTSTAYFRGVLIRSLILGPHSS